jgi:hypothetical protein
MMSLEGFLGIFDDGSVVLLEEDLACEWVVSTLDGGYSCAERFEVVAASISFTLRPWLVHAHVKCKILLMVFLASSQMLVVVWERVQLFGKT